MKQRIIETSFWQDEYVSELNAKEKLTFLYLITNVHVNLCGVYQVSDKTIKIDCDITQPELEAIKKKFSNDNKFKFSRGWVKIVNYSRYSNYKGRDTEKAVKRELYLVPNDIRASLQENNTPPVEDLGVGVRPSNPLISTHINNIEGGVGETNKSSKTSLLPCTPIEIKEIAVSTGVRLTDVERTHEQIKNKIADGTFKGKTVYYSLKNWVLMGIERGSIRKAVAADPLANYKQGSV